MDADVKGAPSNRSRRDAAIFTAIGGVVLHDLIRIVVDYDKLPGQRWCLDPNWLMGADDRQMDASMDRRSVTFKRWEQASRGLKGSSTFEHGAKRWKVRITHASVCWLGIVHIDGLSSGNDNAADANDSTCFYFGSHTGFTGGLLPRMPRYSLSQFYQLGDWAIFEVDVAAGTMKVGVSSGDEVQSSGDEVQKEMVVFRGLQLQHCTPYASVSASGGIVVILSHDE